MGSPAWAAAAIETCSENLLVGLQLQFEFRHWKSKVEDLTNKLFCCRQHLQCRMQSSRFQCAFNRNWRIPANRSVVARPRPTHATHELLHRLFRRKSNIGFQQETCRELPQNEEHASDASRAAELLLPLNQGRLLPTLLQHAWLRAPPSSNPDALWSESRQRGVFENLRDSVTYVPEIPFLQA